MTALNAWLEQATRRLSKDSTAQVRSEIQAHYESAREAAISDGASDEEADRLAVTALGDAKVANCQYRKVLLTSAEAKILRNGNWEARAVCSRPWLRLLLLATSVAVLSAAVALVGRGSDTLPWALFTGGVGIGLVFAAPLLPVYTPARARVFRCVKWIVLASTLALAFGPNAFKSSWLLISCMWPVIWIEGTRTSIRRKLPVADWPKELYL